MEALMTRGWSGYLAYFFLALHFPILSPTKESLARCTLWLPMTELISYLLTKCSSSSCWEVAWHLQALQFNYFQNNVFSFPTPKRHLRIVPSTPNSLHDLLAEFKKVSFIFPVSKYFLIDIVKRVTFFSRSARFSLLRDSAFTFKLFKSQLQFRT